MRGHSDLWLFSIESKMDVVLEKSTVCRYGSFGEGVNQQAESTNSKQRALGRITI